MVVWELGERCDCFLVCVVSVCWFVCLFVCLFVCFPAPFYLSSHPFCSIQRSHFSLFILESSRSWLMMVHYIVPLWNSSLYCPWDHVCQKMCMKNLLLGSWTETSRILASWTIWNTPSTRRRWGRRMPDASSFAFDGWNSLMGELLFVAFWDVRQVQFQLQFTHKRRKWKGASLWATG